MSHLAGILLHVLVFTASLICWDLFLFGFSRRSSSPCVPSGCSESVFICPLFWTSACYQHQKHLAQQKRTFQDHRLTHRESNTHTQILFSLRLGTGVLFKDLASEMCLSVIVQRDNGRLEMMSVKNGLGNSCVCVQIWGWNAVTWSLTVAYMCGQTREKQCM